MGTKTGTINNTKGSVAYFEDGDSLDYSINDFLYLLGRSDKIEQTHKFLVSVYGNSQNDKKLRTMTEICKKHSMSFHIIKILKDEKYIDDQNNWLKTNPNLKDAINVRLKYWKKTKK